ncbi:MAG TPA: tRNA pseudouridine(55) synthase TruB [Bacillota bacterium]
MNGILPLWKPKGLTSHDCVIKVRKWYKTKKVGHAGTLDPEVEGVLPICIGQATKIVPFLMDTDKTYITEMKLGIATETEDQQGKVIAEKEVNNPPSQQEIENVLQSFQGTITQVPPMYSAVKVKGKRLYEYARQGLHVERPKRQITIHQIEHLPSEQSDRTIRMKVVCSKGTYIRTLCVDIGKRLGYPAHMSDLVRIESGPIRQQDTIHLQTVEKAFTQNRHSELLLPIERGIEHLDTLFVDESTKKRVLFGQKLPKPVGQLQTNPFAVKYDNQLLAIYQIHPKVPHEIKPVRVFNE